MLRYIILVAAIAYTIALIIVTFMNIKSVPSLGSSFDDKIYHFLAYFGWAVLWVVYFNGVYKRKTKQILFGFLILFGISLELLQHQINPNRTYDNIDLFANCLGVLVGIIIASRLHIIKLK